ncbi:serine protein kinase [Sodiomyces alkalinus F11]|uniref:non-specific serine/threonine protein kinase n=1 Tax=Sodiomyces alkalinus (strain CBS 110278 / VKM F-3762 / F11) TaxID=1314773 RepID=A0A3N2Q337_SODAK|nr:serine protein kinase [Sodiomyces alkalinus F11]ROT41181.1 serine protein kinase [Sodiomyces alkalinus F11]
MSFSPPPTPHSRASKEDERRFKTITSTCEWVEDYRPGGYHPIHLGDVFNNGQYKVIRKLGEGSYSTVWLGRDLCNNRYVALKFLVSEISRPTEVQILRHIKNLAPVESPKHITQLLDEFQHHGPNGIHNCLVFEPMGPSVNTMVEELPQFKPRKRGMNVRYPPQMAKSILKQSLLALAFLHDNGIAHGDFQPGNMLFTLNDIDSTPEDTIRQEEDVLARSISPPVQRLDGKEDKWAPRYLCMAQPLHIFITDPPEKPVTPLGLRAPELILTGAVDKTLDIWSFGCLIFELITGHPLFWAPGSEYEDDDHLLSLTARLGPLPDELFHTWGVVVEGGEPLVVEQTSMEELFDRAGPDLEGEEAHNVKALVRSMLQYDPAERPSPTEILANPWFRKIEVQSSL